MTHSFDKQYWEQIWQGERAGAMAAGEPNPHLVREIGELTPGTALDAGCGAGAEAIWLAGRGWEVTGVDIAADALARAAERAQAAGLGERVQWVQADLSRWTPEERYDLVTTHYAHPAMPQLEFYDRIASWVAPGGTLLVVGHLHPDNHSTGGGDGERPGGRGHGHGGEGHGGGHGHGGAHGGGGEPPVAASATAAAITALLDPASWDVATAQESHRSMNGPGGREVSIHDVVVRAVRRP